MTNLHNSRKAATSDTQKIPPRQSPPRLCCLAPIPVSQSSWLSIRVCGHIFVTRVAGNVVTREIIASLEYGDVNRDEVDDSARESGAGYLRLLAQRFGMARQCLKHHQTRPGRSTISTKTWQRSSGTIRQRQINSFGRRQSTMGGGQE